MHKEDFGVLLVVAAVAIQGGVFLYANHDLEERISRLENIECLKSLDLEECNYGLQ